MKWTKEQLQVALSIISGRSDGEFWNGIAEELGIGPTYRSVSKLECLQRAEEIVFDLLTQRTESNECSQQPNDPN